MTDLTSSSFIYVRTAFRFPRISAIGIGQKLARFNDALGAAHHMVFVAPYVRQSQKRVISEGSETGRDPNW